MSLTTIKAKVLELLKTTITRLNRSAISERFKKLKKSHQILLTLTILILGIWYLLQKPHGPMMPPAPHVTVYEISPKDVLLEYVYPGKTYGSKEVEIRSRVSGTLLERTYIEGQTVKQGDILFKIDPLPFQIRVEQAEAKLKEEQAILKQAEQGWQRVLDLHTKKMASTREKDQTLSTLDQAKAKVQAAEADLKKAKIDLGYTTVTSPITGISSREAVSEGTLIESTYTPTLLTHIVQIDPIYVSFSYSEAEILSHPQLITSQKSKTSGLGNISATLHFDNGTKYPLKGEVNFTDSVVDPQTGTVQARAVIPNPDGNLLPGQFVRITINGLIQNNVFIVPHRAIMQGPMGPFVYTVNADNKATITPVSLGLSTPQGQIIEKGLQTGNKVITDGMIKVRPNAVVIIEKKEG